MHTKYSIDNSRNIRIAIMNASAKESESELTSTRTFPIFLLSLFLFCVLNLQFLSIICILLSASCWRKHLNSAANTLLMDAFLNEMPSESANKTRSQMIWSVMMMMSDD